MLQSILIGASLLPNIFGFTQPAVVKPHVLGEKNYSLEDRYPNKWVSDIFKDNILLTLAYLRGYGKTSDVNWATVEKPFHYTMDLKPGQVFAFHDDVLPQYQGKVTKTTGAHFNSTEGFKSDGWLVGDGVCHLASFINMVARAAGLNVVSPTRHDFAAIPEVPRDYGVSIYNYPGQSSSNELQNLYITNNRNKEVAFVFDFDGKNLKVSVEESL